MKKTPVLLACILSGLISNASASNSSSNNKDYVQIAGFTDFLNSIQEKLEKKRIELEEENRRLSGEQEEPVQANSIEPKVKKKPIEMYGLTREQNRDIQSALIRLGYSPGTADGLPGAKTRSAIEEYQSDQGTAVTGVPSLQLLEQLQTSLNASSASVNIAAAPAEETTSSGSTQGPTEQAENPVMSSQGTGLVSSPLGGKPLTPSAVFLDPTYPKSYSPAAQHLGVDLPAEEGFSVVSPVTGKVLLNRTSRADPMEKYLVISDSTTGFEHVLGHIESNLEEQTEVRAGETEVGKIVKAGTGAHVHWGINKRSVLYALGEGWGWGRAPATVTAEQAAEKGWIDPLVQPVRIAPQPLDNADEVMVDAKQLPDSGENDIVLNFKEQECVPRLAGTCSICDPMKLGLFEPPKPDSIIKLMWLGVCDSSNKLFGDDGGKHILNGILSAFKVHNVSVLSAAIEPMSGGGFSISIEIPDSKDWIAKISPISEATGLSFSINKRPTLPNQTKAGSGKSLFLNFDVVNFQAGAIDGIGTLIAYEGGKDYFQINAFDTNGLTFKQGVPFFSVSSSAIEVRSATKDKIQDLNECPGVTDTIRLWFIVEDGLPLEIDPIVDRLIESAQERLVKKCPSLKNSHYVGLLVTKAAVKGLGGVDQMIAKTKSGHLPSQSVTCEGRFSEQKVCGHRRWNRIKSDHMQSMKTAFHQRKAAEKAARQAREQEAQQRAIETEKDRIEKLRVAAEQKWKEKWKVELDSGEPWENLTDLMRFNKAATIARLSKGHLIKLEYKSKNVEFREGMSVLEDFQRGTDIYEGIPQGGFSWANWFDATRASASRSFTVSCSMAPELLVGLGDGEKHVFYGTLKSVVDNDYQSHVYLNCVKSDQKGLAQDEASASQGRETSTKADSGDNRSQPAVAPSIENLIFRGEEFGSPISMQLPNDLSESAESSYRKKIGNTWLPPIPPTYGMMSRLDPDLKAALCGLGMIKVIKVPGMKGAGAKTLSYFRYTNDAPKNQLLTLAKRNLSSVSHRDCYEVKSQEASKRHVCALDFTYTFKSGIEGVEYQGESSVGEAVSSEIPGEEKWVVENVRLNDPDNKVFLKEVARSLGDRAESACVSN